MSALYRTLRLALRGALELYFVDIQATGLEHIPKRGAVIFAANHPNSIMDTVILGTQTDREIHYLARSGLFGNPLVAALFNACGVIPVYRAQDDPSQMGRNADSFRRAHDLLLGGGCIGIFPEGHNAPERAVGEIKTGTARIALGAEALADYEAGVQIVPVGLNFENRDRFLSSVLVRFGEPLRVADWGQTHASDPTEAVRDLTSELLERLRQVATHIEDDLTVQLTEDIYDIAGSRLLEEVIGQWKNPRTLGDRFLDELRATPGHKPDLDDVFWMKQRIAKAIEHFQRTDPTLFDTMRKRVRAYKDHLAQVSLRHDLLARNPRALSLRRDAVKFTLYAICFAPLATWGLLGNLLPYTLTRAAALRAPDEAIRAITGFAAGLLLFPLFYSLQAWLVWQATLETGHALTLVALFVLSLPPTGFFYLRWRRQLARYRDRIMARTLFLTDRALVQRLIRERRALIELFVQLRQRFIDEELEIEMNPAVASPDPQDHR